MRSADRDEIKAALGKSPFDGLIDSVALSDVPFTIMADQEPAAMFGAGPVVSGVGCIWLLGTDLILQNSTRFLRESRYWLEICAKPYDLLFNYVDERNSAHIRWIKWLGFTVINRHEKFGVEQRPFLEFVRIS
tara:strand:- start:234 stop:632 length:399 start_codon:yes stop_codon:yes gene_type:complete